MGTSVHKQVCLSNFIIYGPWGGKTEGMVFNALTLKKLNCNYLRSIQLVWSAYAKYCTEVYFGNGYAIWMASAILLSAHLM